MAARVGRTGPGTQSGARTARSGCGRMRARDGCGGAWAVLASARSTGGARRGVVSMDQGSARKRERRENWASKNLTACSSCKRRRRVGEGKASPTAWPGAVERREARELRSEDGGGAGLGAPRGQPHDASGRRCASSCGDWPRPVPSLAAACRSEGAAAGRWMRPGRRRDARPAVGYHITQAAPIGLLLPPRVCASTYLCTLSVWARRAPRCRVSHVHR